MMTNPHSVVADDIDQLGLVLALIRRSFDPMDGVIDPPSSVHRLTVEALASGPGEVWAIGSPPHAAMVLTPRPDVLYLGKLAVDETHRGKGIARQMVTFAEIRASELSLEWIELQTRIELVENHHVFLAMGFVETERTAHDGYDRPTSITYRRQVAPRAPATGG